MKNGKKFIFNYVGKRFCLSWPSRAAAVSCEVDFPGLHPSELYVHGHVGLGLSDVTNQYVPLPWVISTFPPLPSMLEATAVVRVLPS